MGGAVGLEVTGGAVGLVAVVGGTVVSTGGSHPAAGVGSKITQPSSGSQYSTQAWA